VNDLLLKFMKKTGAEKEFKLFYDRYHNLPRLKFAVIKVSGEILETQMETVAEDIAYLNQLGIFPVVVHGAGIALDRALPHTQKKGGHRITQKEDMFLVNKTFSDINQALCQAIIRQGGQAVDASRIFSCQKKPGYGQVGEIRNTDLATLASIVAQSATPVISPLGVCPDGERVNLNADTVARQLVSEINPAKLIMITRTGGVLDEEGKIMPFINLFNEEDFDHVTGGMRLKVREIAEFTKAVPDSSVVITSAENLLREIFTIRGSGTHIKYHRILKIEGTGEIDIPTMTALLENAFDKRLDTAYFTETKFRTFFVEQDYGGVAIVKRIEGVPYLDKLAVNKLYQGTGLARSLWNQAATHYPTLTWRAATTNPFNLFYAKECDGMMRGAQWIVYWRGLPPEQVPELTKQITALPPTLHLSEKTLTTATS